jgi:hypothetical protein
MGSMMEFPRDWPADCPPADAEDAAGVVFRIVRENPPVADDFATHAETGRLPKAPACLRCGLSVFREMRDAEHQRALMPRLGRRIAMATLGSMHGKAMPTSGMQPSHTTWWPYEGVDRARLFSVIEEED